MGAVSTAFVKQYSDMVQHLVQQEATRLRPCVMVDSDFKGEYKFYDQLGQTAAVKRATRHEETPVIDPDHARRRVSSETYVHSFLLDKADELNMIIQPTSDYAKAQAMAFGRAQDQVIYAALGGTAYSGVDGGTATTLDSYASGAHEISETGTFDVDTILTVKQLLDLANNDPMVQRFWVVSPYEIKDLLSATEVKSADYNTVRALAYGQIDTFCGFKFIVLPTTDTTNGIITRASNINTTYAFTADAIRMGIKRDLTLRIDERPDLQYSTQIFAAMDMGAVRMQEASVVKIAVTNAS